MEKIKLFVFLILSSFNFYIANESSASRITIQNSVLPDCLAILSDNNIMEMFLGMEYEGENIWRTADFVEENFFKKLNPVNFDFADDFLKTTADVSVQQYPLEALIWAYSKDFNEQNLVEAKVMGLIYDKSRKGQIKPRKSINTGNMKIADIILDSYFLTLKKLYLLGKSPSLKVKLGNSIKQKVITLIEPKAGEVNHDVISFLSNLYSDLCHNNSILVRGIGRAVYGLNAELELTIKKYINDNLKQSIISFSPKENGAQFGIIVNLKNRKKLFVKAHQNYPYTGRGQTLTGNQLSGASSDSASIRASTIRSVHSVDLKELFAYKVLEYTGFGPKTHFILNEDLVGGLYIGTEEIDDFVTLGNFNEKCPLLFRKFKNKFESLGNRIVKDDFIASGQNDENIIIELTAFDLIARSMLISDLNAENIGFVLNSTEGNSVKVVDFIRPIASKILEMNRLYLDSEKCKTLETAREIMKTNMYVYFDIVKSFLQANTFTKYPDILLKGIFKPNLNPEDLDYEDYIMRFNSQKKSFGLLALNRLNELEPIFNKAFTEIHNFAEENKYVLALNKNISTGKFDDEEKEIMVDPLEDLKQYKGAISVHFQQLSEFLKE